MRFRVVMLRGLLLCAALLLGACASQKGIDDRGAYLVDTRQVARAAFPRVKILVIHYTAGDFDSSLETLLSASQCPLSGARISASAQGKTDGLATGAGK